MEGLTMQYCVCISRVSLGGTPAYSGQILLSPRGELTGDQARFEFIAGHSSAGLDIEISGSPRFEELIRTEETDTQPIFDLFAMAVRRAIDAITELAQIPGSAFVETSSIAPQRPQLMLLSHTNQGATPLWQAPPVSERTICSLEGTVHVEGPVIELMLQLLACTDSHERGAATGTDLI